MEIKKIGILGAGIMGSGIAQVASMSGFSVVVQDIAEACLTKGRERIQESLNKMVKSQKIGKERVGNILGAILWTRDISHFAGSHLIIEAIPESVQIKQEMYNKITDFLSPDAIIASNTSSISISLLGSAVTKPERFIGMHWFNPPVLMRMVEIVKGIQTSEETVRAITSLCKSMGKEFVICRDSQGFVTTRLLVAFRLECYRAYEEGIASKEDIDKACRLAFGHPMGQFELADLSGLDIEVDIMRGLVDAYGDRFRPPQSLLNLVSAGKIGRKSGSGWYNYGQQ